MVSAKNWQCFYLFNIGKIGQENVFANILERKKMPFHAIKTGSEKRRKLGIFPKGLVHCFGQKLAIFPSLYCGQNRPEKCVWEYSRRKKKPFQTIKQEAERVEKTGIFSKGVSPWFWSKIDKFFYVFNIGKIGQENVFKNILQREKAFSDYKNKKLKNSKWLVHRFLQKSAIFPFL